MARKFLTPLDLAKNELQNGVIQNLAAAPSSPVKGQLYMNTSDNTLYWWDGSAWASARGGGTGFPGFGTITAETTYGLAKNDGVGTTTARNDHTHGSPPHTTAEHTTFPLSTFAVPTTNVSMNGFKITSLGTPTTGTDAVTKDYADNLSAGLSYKDAVRAATTANITLSAPQTIDGVSLIANDRVLVKDQSTATQNGIYTVAAGAWVRATDADAVGELDGAFVVSMEGTLNGDKAWICSTNPPITPGTTATTWVYYGAGTAYTAGTGLTLTGSTFDVVATNASIVVAADSVGVGFAGSGSAVTAAKSDHNHDAAYPPLTRTLTAGAGLAGGGDLSANRTFDVGAGTGILVAADSVAVDTSTIATVSYVDAVDINKADKATQIIAGSGLTGGGTLASSKTLDVGAGTGITVAADTVALDTSYTDGRYALTASGAKRYAVDVGGATSQVLTHNLNTLDVIVQVYRKAGPNDQIECDVEHTSVNTSTLRFAVAPSAAEYRAVVMA